MKARRGVLWPRLLLLRGIVSSSSEYLSRTSTCNGMHGPAGNIMSMISSCSCLRARTLSSADENIERKMDTMHCVILFEDVFSMQTMPICVTLTMCKPPRYTISIKVQGSGKFLIYSGLKIIIFEKIIDKV